MTKVAPALSRLALVVGGETVERLRNTSVYVFGLGGVGSWAAEALVRSGIGRITIVDSDTVCVTNVNRQVEATRLTIGEDKTAALKKRLLEIAPECEIRAVQKAYTKEDAASFALEDADYVIDAIDSLTHKVDLIEECARAGVTLFSCMGMAQKLDPLQIQAASIWETQGCPLARLVRERLRKNGFTGDFTAVFSPERLPLQEVEGVSCGGGGGVCFCPVKKEGCIDWCAQKKVINGSVVTVTGTAGFTLASLVLRDIAARCGAKCAEKSLV